MMNRGVPYHFTLARQEDEVVDGHDDSWPREVTGGRVSKVVVGVGMIVGGQTGRVGHEPADRCTDVSVQNPTCLKRP